MYRKQMEKLSSNGQLIEAMNVFDVLETQFAGSADYPNAVLLARGILPTLKLRADHAKAELKRQASASSIRLKDAKGNERKVLENELSQQKRAVETAIANAEKTRAKWLPLQPATDRSLETLLSRISSESSRLAALPVGKMIESTSAAKIAGTLLGKDDLAGAEAALEQAASLWPRNEAATRMKKNLHGIKAKMAAEKSAREKAAKGQGVP